MADGVADAPGSHAQMSAARADGGDVDAVLVEGKGDTPTQQATPTPLTQRMWAWSRMTETNEFHYAMKVALGVSVLTIPLLTTVGAPEIRLTWAVVTVRRFGAAAGGAAAGGAAGNARLFACARQRPVRLWTRRWAS